jgi:hypothetical protein
MPSLSDCFPCGSVDLGKYVLYFTSLGWRAHWHTSLAMLLGGLGTLSFFMDDNADNADVPRVKRTQTQHCIYVWQDTVDGPLEIIPPEE